MKRRSALPEALDLNARLGTPAIVTFKLSS